MADIIRVDLTNVQDTLQGSYTWGFELVNYANGSSLSLAAGRTENIGGTLYRVEDGDLAIPAPGSDDTWYVYITEDGDGTATASVSTTVPTFNPNNGGYYNGASKAVFIFDRIAVANYIKKQKLISINLDADGKLSLKKELQVDGDTVILGTLSAIGGLETDSINALSGTAIAIPNSDTLQNVRKALDFSQQTYPGGTVAGLFAFLDSANALGNAPAGTNVPLTGHVAIDGIAIQIVCAKVLKNGNPATSYTIQGWDVAAGNVNPTVQTPDPTQAGWSIAF